MLLSVEQYDVVRLGPSVNAKAISHGFPFCYIRYSGLRRHCSSVNAALHEEKCNFIFIENGMLMFEIFNLA